MLNRFKVVMEILIKIKVSEKLGHAIQVLIGAKLGPTHLKRPEDRLNMKMSSYQYRDPHVIDKTVSRPSYL